MARNRTRKRKKKKKKRNYMQFHSAATSNNIQMPLMNPIIFHLWCIRHQDQLTESNIHNLKSNDSLRLRQNCWWITHQRLQWGVLQQIRILHDEEITDARIIRCSKISKIKIKFLEGNGSLLEANWYGCIYVPGLNNWLLWWQKDLHTMVIIQWLFVIYFIIFVNQADQKYSGIGAYAAINSICIVLQRVRGNLMI